VKIVTPEPEAVDHFLREVLEIPDGWVIPGARPVRAHPPVKANPVTWESVIARRGDDGSGGYITGSPESRQFQILRGAQRTHLEHRGRHAPHRARAPALRRARDPVLRRPARRLERARRRARVLRRGRRDPVRGDAGRAEGLVLDLQARLPCVQNRERSVEKIGTRAPRRRVPRSRARPDLLAQLVLLVWSKEDAVSDQSEFKDWLKRSSTTCGACATSFGCRHISGAPSCASAGRRSSAR
jgi:hypothetical protein